MRNTTLVRFFALLALFISICTDYSGANELTFSDTNVAIHAVRSWIEDGLHVPEEYHSQLPEDTSACIILRHHGQLLGVGVSSNSKQPLIDAATSAFAEANSNSSFSQLSPEFKELASSSISIELELGSKPIPSPHKNFKRFAKRIEKGINGVAVRRMEKWGVRMPAAMRLSPRRTISSVLASICLNVGVHPSVAVSGNLSTTEDVTLYIIPTITGFQKNTGDEIKLLIRGDELVSQIQNKSELEELAQRLATHLIACIRESGSVIGGYQPETDSLSPPLATPFIQLMVAAALEEYAELAQIEERDISRKKVSLIMGDVEKKFYDNDNIPTTIASAVVIAVSLSQAPWSEEIQQFITACDKTTITVARDIVNSNAEIEKPHSLAMIALAISKIAVQTQNKNLQVLAEKTCLHCINSVPLQSKVSIIPWITEAVLLLNINGSTLPVAPLDELVDLALSSQIRNKTNSDLLGGFLLKNEVDLEVDARGIRMLPMLVQMCNVKGQNRIILQQSALATTRFIAQLTTTKERANRFQNPALSIGGVRASLWDASMPTEATAMALIGVTRLINASTTRGTEH